MVRLHDTQTPGECRASAAGVLWSLALLAAVAASAIRANAQSASVNDLPLFETPDRSFVINDSSTESLPPPPTEGLLEPIPSELTEDLELRYDAPVATESSGTWLRRGLWYADLDAVVMSRTWDSDGVTYVNGTPVTPPFFSQRRRIGESSPSSEASARLSLGRFLFRDLKNRDHNAEMVVFGGAEWDDKSSITGITPNSLLVPANLTGLGARPNFTFSTEMDLEYSSRLTSFEWNYSVTERMRRDRMELLPSGKWVRRAAPGFTHEFLAGLRYIDLEENVDWFATDIASIAPTVDGSYLIRTSNNMFGPQLGYGLTYETNRWNITLNAKNGFLVNDARLTSDLTYKDSTNPDFEDTFGFSNVDHENRLNYMLQFSVLSRYHLRPNVSLRFGWEMLWLHNLSLAPNEMNFDADRPMSTTADAIYHGFVFGGEYYW